jgi:PAS domain-containing protein
MPFLQFSSRPMFWPRPVPRNGDYYELYVTALEIPAIHGGQHHEFRGGSRVTSTPIPPSGDASEEISVLIRTLREADQRLDELTAGQIDTVADRDGRSFLLHHAQDELRDTQKRGEERSRRFGKAMDAIVDAIYLVDRSSMQFVHVNDAACRLLRLMKCDEMQGYLVSVPVSSDILEKRYLARAPPVTAPHRFAIS